MLQMDRGYLRLFVFRGAPVRVHWTMPLGAFVFGGLTFAPVFWVAFLVLILVHEVGHAVFVRRLGHRVLAIDVTGLGGVCRWSGHASSFHRGLIAWGGVTAQAALLLATLVVTGIVGSPVTTWGAQLTHAFITTNLWLMALNLIPAHPFDGAEAWPVARTLWRRMRDRWRSRTRGSHPPREDAESSAKREAPSRRGSPPRAGRGSNELADLLRGVGDDARRARQGRR